MKPSFGIPRQYTYSAAVAVDILSEAALKTGASQLEKKK